MSPLKPHKLKDIKKEPIVVAAYIEKYLQENGGFSRMKNLITDIKNIMNIPEKNISLGINFLYVLGKIEYDKEQDTFRKVQ